VAAWLIPALKAVLPHLGTVVSMAAPVFTKARDEKAGASAVVQQQIAELQSAVSQNATQIRELARQLQSTVAALEQAAAVAESRLRRVVALGIAAGAISIVALAVAAAAALGR
jgi:DNA-directed RNA polymerase sigma subunit (sigma70/sigma32)